jgi:hypothetical protein
VSGFSRTGLPDAHDETSVLPYPGSANVPVTTEELATNVDPESAIGRITSVAVVIGALAAIVAGATIWLLLTDPVTILNAVDEGQVSPLVRQLADILYNALAGLLDYL